jgi:hypothetical protein
VAQSHGTGAGARLQLLPGHPYRAAQPPQLAEHRPVPCPALRCSKSALLPHLVLAGGLRSAAAGACRRCSSTGLVSTSPPAAFQAGRPPSSTATLQQQQQHPQSGNE